MSVRNEGKLYRMSFFTDSKLIRDHFLLCTFFLIRIYFESKNFQKKIDL